jgi:methionyl-tRNA formyltransferase
MPSSDVAHEPVHPQSLRIVFFGMAGQFSLLVLEELLGVGIEIAAVVLPALGTRAEQPPLRLPQQTTVRGRALPMFAVPAPRTILDLATDRNAPVLELSGQMVPDLLAGLTFDAICVACFSRRLPPSLLHLPRLGCLNVHPSLLPAHRGPDPLFWIFHDGDETGGVTIHLMDEGFDTGPIVLNEAIPISDGTTEAQLERACAVRGGQLLAEALIRINAGNLQPLPQDASRASYESWPTADDFTLMSAWSAQRAYRFLAGIGGRGEPIHFVADDATFTLRAVLDYDASRTLDAAWQLTGDVLSVQCTPGVLRCQIAA